MTVQITGEVFKSMIINAAAAIDNHKQEINDLNVFPVPDGDTGTNMSLTIGAAEAALRAMTPGTLGHTAHVAAGALLRGARGNSGVILSLLFRGLSRRLKDKSDADAVVFSSAMEAGVESAYKAVMKPAEGTILTVSRLAAGAAAARASENPDIEEVLKYALSEGYEALQKTVEQNPVLAKAGVIDAGAKGYLYILDGMLKALYGITLTKSSGTREVNEKADFSLYRTQDIKFAYCTEFIVERKPGKDANRLRDFLDVRGDSIVVVDDDEIIKVHVHTNEPGIVITEALNYGALTAVKIENMHEQHTETLDIAPAPEREEEPRAAKEQKEKKAFGFVVVCMGSGIEEVFRDLGADEIIAGGQTMNPSTQSILEKINETPSDTVFVLPNNKNIIMAAEQCVPLTEKRVIIIPTKSMPQGISAMLATDGLSDTDEMAERMKSAAARVRTAQITAAVRDTVFDGTVIKQGEFIALLDDMLIASGLEKTGVIGAVTEKLSEDSPDFITVFAGEDTSDEDLETAAGIVSVKFPQGEITTVRGGQPVYHYIISAE